MEGLVPRKLASGHGEGAINSSARVSRRIPKRAHCPNAGLEAGGFAPCLVAAIIGWQPRAS